MREHGIFEELREIQYNMTKTRNTYWGRGYLGAEGV